MPRRFLSSHPLCRFLNTLLFVGLVTLILLIFVADRSPVFFDVLSQTDVSSQYTSRIPPLRYLFEPFIGIIAVIASREISWITPFLILYLIGRPLWRRLLKRAKRGTKTRVLVEYIRKLLRFNLRVTLSLFIPILLGFALTNTLWGGAFAVHFGADTLLYGLYICGGALLLRSALCVMGFLQSGYPSLVVTTPPPPSHPLTKIWRGITRELSAFLSILFLLLLMNYLSLSLSLPLQTIESSRQPGEYLFDFHVHTTASDGFLTPEERVEWYVNQGINGAVFTDHHVGAAVERARQYVREQGLDFIVIPGIEYTCEKPHLHMNIFGTSEDIFPAYFTGDPYASKSLDIKAFINDAHQNGHYVTVNHYNGSVRFSLEELKTMGVDGFEISTGYLTINDKKIRDFCLKNHMICVGGSDEHENRELNRFVRLRLSETTEPDTDTIFQSLRQSTHQVVRVELYPQKVDISPNFGYFSSVENLINYFLNLNTLQILSWIAWLSLLTLLMNQIALIITHMDSQTVINKVRFL